MIDRVQIVAAHVVVVVGHRAAELLTVGGIFPIIGLVAVVIVTLTGQEMGPSLLLLCHFVA